jgi:hypothetical protein
MQKRSEKPKFKLKSDADSSLRSDEPQSSIIIDHVSNSGGPSAEAEESTPLEQEGDIDVPVPLPCTVPFWSW